MNELNDVSEYLNELIPYRCPKCGNLRRFATLRELRQHLQVEHSFQMGFVRPHPRACVFNRSTNAEHNGIRRNDQRNIFEKEEMKQKNNRFANQLHNFRESSPLLDSFKSETENLEKELQRAIQIEMRHKTSSMQNLADNTINADCHNTLNTISNRKHANQYGQGNQPLKHEHTYHIPYEEKTKRPPFPHIFQPMQVPLTAMNSDVQQSNLNLLRTTESLSKSQEVLNEMENNIEAKCQEQRNIIQELVQDMKTKDEQIELNRKRHSDLKNEREKLLREQETLMQRSGDFNSKLKDDLNDKHTELDTLNEELSRLKKLSEHELHLKSKDLQQATERANRLELERDTLIKETEKILKNADEDNENLKQQLHEKELELSQVNNNLKQIRSQQEQMLERTVDVYNSSEDNRELMQTAIKTKDQQLQQAIQQIENMANMQRRLVEQSRVLTDQADDNTENMKHLLETKAKQMEHLTTQLETLKSEKRYIENNTACLTDKAESSLSTVDSLQKLVRQREIDLKATQTELHQLKTFLKSAGDKERIARQKLESFIEDLMYRAERAESELRSLKSQSSDTINKLEQLSTESHADRHIDDETSIKRFIELTPGHGPRDLKSPEPFIDNCDNFVENILQKNLNKRNQSFTDESNPEDNTDIANENVRRMREIDTLNQRNFTGNVGQVGLPNNESETNNFNQGLNSIVTVPDVDSVVLQLSEQTCEDRTVYHLQRNNDDPNFLDSKFTNNLPDSSEEIYDDFNEHVDQSFNNNCDSNEKITSYNEPDMKDKKVSRKVQVGSFLSSQSVYDNVSDDCSGNNNAYNSQDIVRTHKQATVNKRVKNRRPATIGKSHQNIRKRKVNIKRNTALNDKFDSNFPDIRRSMTDIGRDSRDTSEGEIRLHDRRSRSLSPRIMESRKFFIDQSRANIDICRKFKREIVDTNDDDDEFDEDTEYSVDASVIDGLSRDYVIDDECYQDHTDGVFNNIMDENGILWEDDDNATLPDVSDFEFDRVSPSGSEAISSHRNPTPNVMSVPNSITKTGNNSPVKRSKQHRVNTRHEAVISPSTSSVVCLLNNSSSDYSENECVGYKTTRKVLDEVKRNRIKHGHKTSRDEHMKAMSKTLFKPITSSPDNKSTISDKDMTSGGREVHSFMRNTPNSEQLGLADSLRVNKTTSKTEHSNSSSLISGETRTKGKDNKPRRFQNSQHTTAVDVSKEFPSSNNKYARARTETAEDTINRISRQYSPKHSKSSFKTEPNSIIDGKINSINEKYKQRRQNILDGKGVGTIVEPSHHHAIQPSFTATKYRSTGVYDTQSRQSSAIPISQSITNHPRQHNIPNVMPPQFRYIPVQLESSINDSPQPLPFVDGAGMCHNPAFSRITYDTHGNLQYDVGTVLHGNLTNAVAKGTQGDVMNVAATGSHGHITDVATNGPHGDIKNIAATGSQEHLMNGATNDSQGHLVNAVGPDSHGHIVNGAINNPYVNSINVAANGLQGNGMNFERNVSHGNPMNFATNGSHRNLMNVPDNDSQFLTPTNSHQLSSYFAIPNMAGPCQPQQSNVSIVGQHDNITSPKYDLTETTNECLPKEQKHDDAEVEHDAAFKNMKSKPQGTAESDIGKNVHTILQSLPTLTENKEPVDPVLSSVIGHTDSNGPESSNDSSLYIPYKDVREDHIHTESHLLVADPLAMAKYSTKETDTFDETVDQLVTNSIGNDEVCLRKYPAISLSAFDSESDTTSRVDTNTPHLKLFKDVDTIESDLDLSKFSVFAGAIDDDDTSLACVTNSFMDLPGVATDSDLDGETDTESVRRDFYEKSQHIKEVLESSTKVRSDILGHRKAALSSASSQG